MSDTEKSNAAVWASDIAREFASSIEGDYLTRASEEKLIFEALVHDIKSGLVLVYVRLAGRMNERKSRATEPSFPVGDYQLRRATAQAWFSSRTGIPETPSIAQDTEALRTVEDFDYSLLAPPVGIPVDRER